MEGNMSEKSKQGVTWKTCDIKMLIDNRWVNGERRYDVVDPYRGGVVSTAPMSNEAELDIAMAAAVRAKPKAADMPGYERARIIRRAAELLGARRGELAEIMSRESGKAIKDCHIEVVRSIETLTLSAEEAVRIQGEHIPLDSTPLGAGKLAVLLRFPVGVVAAITPYNSPLNLACHKVGPALAAGNSIVLKASPQAPGVVHILAEAFLEAGLPPGFLNTLYGRDIGPALACDPRADLITFTGSTRAGAEIRARSGLRRVALELGGIGPVIVHDDAQLDEAASMCARYAMRAAGQSCVSVQNIFVHDAVATEFRDRLRDEVKRLKLGDPLDETTDIGTLIDAGATDRVAASVDEALSAGAETLTGGKRIGPTIFAPTVLTGVDRSMRAVSEEMFGPVATIRTYDQLDPIFSEISECPLGLQGGVFTRSMEIAFRAVRSMRTGGVIVNGVPTWRSDQMPYGGVKNSGIGREGPKYAIREMTDERLVVFNL